MTKNLVTLDRPLSKVKRRSNLMSSPAASVAAKHGTGSGDYVGEEPMTRAAPAKARPNEVELDRIRQQLELAERKFLRLHELKHALRMSHEDFKFFESKFLGEIERWRDAERELQAMASLPHD
jgi:hypothetical protein